METNAKHGAVGRRPDAAALGLGLDQDFNPGSMLPRPPATVLCGDLELDRAARRALLAGTDLHLTERECALLLCLADHTNRVMRRSDLLARVWMLPDDDGSNLVAVYIRRLRQKLGAHAGMIVTIRGIGYRLRPALDD
jgi:DNA-binding response OmpR family regulator